MAEQHEWYRDEQTGQYVHDVSVFIDVPVEKCFDYWSNFENFPRIMRHVKHVVNTGEGTWHWEAQIDGQHAEWDAVMPDFQMNRMISWRSTNGLKNSGTVTFTPENTGCRIAVHLMYDPPYGLIGDLVAQLTVNETFHKDLQQDLLSFKRAVETGEVERFRPAA